jgi:hypothetical protein
VSRVFTEIHMTRPLVRSLQLLAVAAAATACSKMQEPPKRPLTEAAGDSARRVEAANALIGPAAKVALDSGNALFRKKLYAPALAQYRAAGDLAPQHAAPLFGVYMVARAMGNTALADSALAGIRARNGGSPAAVPHGTSDSALKELRARMKVGTAG